MNTIKIHGEDLSFYYKKGENLLDILRDNGVSIETPCSGKGNCGKCKIQILEGKVNNPTEEELKYISKAEIEKGIRLSCFVYPENYITVKLLGKKEQRHKILSSGFIPDIEHDPIIRKDVIELKKPTLENSISHEELLEKTIGQKLNYESPMVLKAISNVCTEEKATLIYWKDKVIGIEPGDTKDILYGVAVDIGTTTVVASLVDLNSGREVDVETSVNPQKQYGLDVLSRIDFIKRKEKGLHILQKAIVDCLNTLIKNLCCKNNIDIKNIYEITVGANSTMMHILLGVDTYTIGKSPYATIFSREKNLSAESIGLKISPFGRLYCLPGVSSYIGADIVAGAVVADLKNTKDNVIFIDIGTNGEMILSKGGKLVSCSCAAGPALEGANISCGMRAAEGAIESVQFNEDGVFIKVIGNTEPIGICGSGILEIMSELNEKGLIKKTGRLKKREDLEKEGRHIHAQYLFEENKNRKVKIYESKDKLISISQRDIRQIQLAKGAISSGIYALSEFMGITLEELDNVIIAGQFGKHLKVSSLIGVGIIPESLKDKVKYVGNSSKTGAMMCLLSRNARKQMENISKDIDYFELSAKKDYEKLFTKCLSFN